MIVGAKKRTCWAASGKGLMICPGKRGGKRSTGSDPDGPVTRYPGRIPKEKERGDVQRDEALAGHGRGIEGISGGGGMLTHLRGDSEKASSRGRICQLCERRGIDLEGVLQALSGP